MTQIMPTAPGNKPKQVTRVCLRRGCEGEANLTLDTETGDYEGRCGTCGFDVGTAVNSYERRKALSTLEEEEQGKSKEKKKKSGELW
jgi:hypothetical protein